MARLLKPVRNEGDVIDQGLSSFLSTIEMPRTELDMLEWFERVSNFKPHAGQRKVIEAIQQGKREIDIIAGKRSGKSRLVREIALYYVAGLSKRVWILGPTWDVVDRIFFPLWDQIMDMQIEIVHRDRDTRIIRTASGGVLEGLSWRTPEQIEAEGIHVAITDESQYLTRAIADKIRARLVGDWLWLRIGSPDEFGLSFFEEDALAAEAAKIPTRAKITWPTWINPDPEVRRSVKIAREDLEYLKNAVGADHPAYLQRKRYFDSIYGGQPQPPQDIAIGTFNQEVHVRSCPFDPDLPVYLGIDPGYYPSYYAVVAFQPHPWGEALGLGKLESKLDELWQIDEIYVQHTITDDVIDMCKKRPWWGNVTRAVIDVAARQRQRQTGMSDMLLWQQAARFPVHAEWVSQDDAINTHRRWLAQNRLFHDKDKCPNTIKEYLLHKIWVPAEGNVRDRPIDRWNHAHKALEYLIVVTYGVTDHAVEPIQWYRTLPKPERRRWTVVAW